MNPGHQRTVAFVLILVTREALSLTAFGDGDYYADVRGGESPYKLSVLRTGFSVLNLALFPACLPCAPYKLCNTCLPLLYTFQDPLNQFRDFGNIKVKVNFTLKQATKAQRGSRGIVLLFL